MGRGHQWRLGPPLGVLTPISKAHQESINTSGRGQRVRAPHTLRHTHTLSARTLPTHMVLSEEISITSHIVHMPVCVCVCVCVYVCL